MKVLNEHHHYESSPLSKSEMHNDPLIQLCDWIALADKHKESMANAAVLSTSDKNNVPDSRVILVKSIKNNQIFFYTNYTSKKASDIAVNNCVSLLFYWKTMHRQIRILGKAQKISVKDSAQYFHSRPFESQLVAIASKQSQELESKNELQNAVHKLVCFYEDFLPDCPEYWGGYAINPYQFEYWQGQPNRFHDRFQYNLVNHGWSLKRLYP